MGDGKGSGYISIIPDAPGVDSHPLTKEFAEKIGDLVDQYVKAMEKVSVYTRCIYMIWLLPLFLMFLSLAIETVQTKEWIRTRDENLRRGK